jgi:hypothetical protein
VSSRRTFESLSNLHISLSGKIHAIALLSAKRRKNYGEICHKSFFLPTNLK